MTEQLNTIGLPRRSLFDPGQGEFSPAFTETDASKLAADVLQNMGREAWEAGYTPYLERLYAGREVDAASGLVSVWLNPRGKPETVAPDGCVVLIGGFGMRLSEIVLLAEYWQRVNEARNRNVQVLALGLPDAALDLAKPSNNVAETLLRVVDERCGNPSSIETVAYSAGNLPAIALTQLAIQRGKQVPSMVVGALPNPEPDSSVRRSLAFFREASRGGYPPGIPGIFAAFRPPDNDAPRLRDVPGKLIRLQRTLTAWDAPLALQNLLLDSPGTRLVLGFAAGDLIGRDKPMQKLIKGLAKVSGSDVWGVRIEDRSHDWARCVPVLGEQASLALRLF